MHILPLITKQGQIWAMPWLWQLDQNQKLPQCLFSLHDMWRLSSQILLGAPLPNTCSAVYRKSLMDSELLLWFYESVWFVDASFTGPCGEAAITHQMRYTCCSVIKGGSDILNMWTFYGPFYSLVRDSAKERCKCLRCKGILQECAKCVK